MQIVIEIDEENYNDLTLTGENTIPLSALLHLREALRNGTPLPKGHGNLIDADKLVRPEIRPFLYHLKNGDTVIPEIDILHAPTIIEADKGEEK